MPSETTTPTYLPANYTPGEHDVVIGKGKKFYFHAGNQWLRNIVAARVPQYSGATNKADKSSVISGVVEYVKAHGQFVKLDNTGAWIYAEPLLCREKCSQTFRDNLAETYRSSNVAKRNKRRAEQREKTNFAVARMMNVNINMCPPPPPQAKRMRLSPPVPQVQQIMQPMQVPSSPNTSCTSWFDWDMPVFQETTTTACSRTQDMEPLCVPSSSSYTEPVPCSLKEMDDIFLDLSSNHNQIVDDFEPIPALSAARVTVKPIQTPSSSFIDQSSGFRLANDFQRRTPAAFAA